MEPFILIFILTFSAGCADGAGPDWCTKDNQVQESVNTPQSGVAQTD